MARKSLEEHFLKKIDFESFRYDNQCWEWTACKCGGGYERIRVDGRLALAHRVAYRLYLNQDFPIFSDDRSVVLDHYYCQNPGCVNPFHLELVSLRENTSRGRLSDMNGKKASKYRGVCWHKRDKKWQARIWFEGNSKYLGYFDNEEEAAEAYQEALKNGG